MAEELIPHTITIELTVSATSVDEADALGHNMLDYICSGYDGIAGAVVRIIQSDMADPDPTWDFPS